MESELHDLRALVEDYKTKFIVADTERKTLKIEVALLQKKCDERLERMTKVESMMTHLASGLHAGLKEMREERDIERAVRRQSQEEQLEKETGAAPSFLRTPVNSRVEVVHAEDRDQHVASDPIERAPVQPAARRESDEDREDRLRGAAERLAQRRVPPPQPPGTPNIDTTLADRDPRMPGGPFTRADAGELEQLAGQIRSGGR